MPSKKESSTSDLIDPKAVKNVRSCMPAEEALFDLAELFKVFGDSTRIRILSALSINTLCVHDLAQVLNMTQSAISHQLKMLRFAKLVRQQKSGKATYYSLDDEHVDAIMAIGMQHIGEEHS